MTDPIDRPEPLPVPLQALSIGAHPDDAEFGAGGTLAKWARAGCQISMLIITDGSKGTWEPEVSAAELAEARKQEQKAAADALGVTGELVHLGYPDGELENSMALREEICLWIRRLRPTVVVTHDPWRRYQIHPDHRAAGFAAIDGVVAARDHGFFPHQGLDKHRPETLLLWSADEPDHWEDISTTFEIKLAALVLHRSQAASSMGGDVSEGETAANFKSRMHDWSSTMGQPVGLDLAESFKLIRP